MGIGEKILSAFTGSGALGKGLDLVDQLVDDEDEKKRLQAAMYIAELQTSTVPIIDGIHKLGRQILAMAQIVFYAWAVSKGIPITWELVAGVSGVAGAYTLAKGKGK